MSASSATATQAVVAAPERTARRPVATAARLRILPPPSTPRVVRARAPKAPFVILVSLLLAGGLVGLLLLNTLVDQDAFRLHALRAGQSGLDVQEAQLRQTADDDADPASLAARAAALGMVPAGAPRFVRAAKLPKGQRIGNLIAVAGPAPEVTPPAPVASAPAVAVTTAATAPTTTPSAPTSTPTSDPSTSTRPTTKATSTKTSKRKVVTTTHAKVTPPSTVPSASAAATAGSAAPRTGRP